MKLRTKVEVNYNNGASGTSKGIIEGRLQDCVWLEDFNVIGANYNYTTPEGKVFHKDGFTVENEKIEALYSSIKDSIPEGLDYRSTNRFSFYLGFIFEMSKTFGVEFTDIEIVV